MKKNTVKKKIKNLKLRRRVLFILFSFLLFFGFFGPAFGQLEIQYPEFAGIKPEVVTTSLPAYIKYIYYFLIGIGGLIALGALIYGSVRYIASFGNPQTAKEGRDQILAAISGLIILLASWLIVHSINPEITTFRLPPIRPALSSLSAGVWLCKEQTGEIEQIWKQQAQFRQLEAEAETASEDRKEKIVASQQKLIKDSILPLLEKINQKCYLVGGQGDIQKGFHDEVKYLYLVPGRAGEIGLTNYGAFVFEDRDFKGKNKAVFWPSVYQVPVEANLQKGKSALSKPSSIIPFIVNPFPESDWKVVVYEETGYNSAFTNKRKQEFPKDCETFSAYWCEWPLTQFSPQSIRILPTGSYLALLSVFSSRNLEYTSSDVITGNDGNLLDNERIRRKKSFVTGSRAEYEPAANWILIISAKIY